MNHSAHVRDDLDFVSQGELDYEIDTKLGSKDRIENELSTKILLASDANLPNGYVLSGDNKIMEMKDSSALYGLTDPNGKGGSIIYIAPRAKSYEIGSSGNPTIYHELIHANHIKLGLNRNNNYSEIAASVYSFRYNNTNGNRLAGRNYFEKIKDLGGFYYPASFSLRNMPKFINSGLK